MVLLGFKYGRLNKFRIRRDDQMNINNSCVLLCILFCLLIGLTLFVVSTIRFFAENRKSNRSYIKIFGWSVMIFITALQIILIVIYIIDSLLLK